MIVKAKLLVPTLSPRHVVRPQLLAAAVEHPGARLITLVAPAGYGKSSVLAELLADGGGIVSLDADDDDPHRFWAYVGHALANALGLDSTALADALLQPGAPPLSTVITTWSNAALTPPRAGIVALDDFHVLSDSRIFEALARFVDRLPAGVTVVIASRVALPLPLSRWRARAELREIDASQLRLTSVDAARFLQARLQRPLSSRDVAALVEHTEGWAVALQLAAASLALGHDDVASFIGGATPRGPNVTITEYLTEQIVGQLDEASRRFLLDACVLETLTPDDCAAVTEDPNAAERLVGLERDNVPLTALHARRHAYRLHPLLTTHLRELAWQRDPARARACERRATEIAVAAGDLERGLAHALRAQDIDRAVELLVQRAHALMRGSRPLALLREVRRVGRGYTQLPSALLMPIAYASYLCAHPTELRASLTELVARRSTGLLDDPLWAQVCNLRSALARAQGDIDRAVAFADDGLALDPADASGLLLYRAVALFVGGRHDEAASSCARCLAAESGDGPPAFIEITAQSLLAQVRLEQGRCGEATQLCDTALARLTAHGLQQTPMVALVDRTQGRIALEQGRWQDAYDALRRASARADEAGLADLYAVVEAWLAQWAVLVQDDTTADRALAAIERAAGRDAWLCQWHAALGARRTLASSGAVSPQSVDGLADEACAMTELRRLPPGEAEVLATVMLTRSRQAGRVTTEVAIVATIAELAAEAGRASEADRSLERALTLATPGALVRGFAEGDLATMRRLIARALGSKRLGRSVVAHANVVGRALEQLQRRRSANTASDSAEPGLSARELEVLQLVAGGSTNHQVATLLHVSMSTVKTHLNHIFDKLGVRRRTPAIARARELGLL